MKQAIRKWLGLEDLDREVKTLSVTSFASVEAIKDLQAKRQEMVDNQTGYVLTVEE